MYISSPEDTAKREVDDRAVGTILYSPIRPEFRGPVRSRCAAWLCDTRLRDSECQQMATAGSPQHSTWYPQGQRVSAFASGGLAQVACFLASTTKENRTRFHEVCTSLVYGETVVHGRIFHGR